MTQDDRKSNDGGPPAEREPVYYLEEVRTEETGIGAGRAGGRDTGLDWRRLLHSLWRRKWIVLAASLAGVVAGMFLMQRSQPLYQTRSTIWLGPADEQSGPIRPAEIFEGQGWADLLSSQAVLEPVVEERRLYVSPVRGADTAGLSGIEVTGRVQPGRYRLRGLSNGRFELRRVYASGYGLSGLFDGDLSLTTTEDSVVQRGELGDAPIGEPVGFRWSPEDSTTVRAGSEMVFRVTRPSDAVGRLRSRLLVAYSSDAGNLINTQFTWPTSGGAAGLHNAILESFMQVAQRLKSQKQKEVVNILEEQTRYAAARLDSAELALRNFRVETITLPGEPRTTSVPGADEESGGSGPRSSVFGEFFEQRLTRDELRSHVDELEGVLDRLQSTGELDVMALRMSGAVDRSQQLQQALTRLTELQGERRSMLTQYTEDYPPVQELTSRIRTQEQEVIPELVRELIRQLQGRVQQLDQRITSRASDLREIPKRSIQEQRLRREVNMAEQLHSNLLTRLKEAELSARTNLPDLQVVDRATPPGVPSENSGPRLFVLASMAGIGLGVGASFLLDRLDRKIRYPDQVTDDIGIRILGAVPRIRSGWWESEDRQQEALEAFRGIRGQISRMGGAHPSTFLITSPAPREGKTLVTSNLGISFARTGARTVVVDCDTRRGNLHEMFERAASPGVAEVLQGDADLADVEVTTEYPGLRLVPRGSVRGFNAELLDSPEMDRMLDQLRQRHDVVLLDASPLHAGPDSLFLGERADQVVVVLRTGQTDRDEAMARLAGIGNFDLPVVGAVMNDVRGIGEYYRYYHYSESREDRSEDRLVTG